MGAQFSALGKDFEALLPKNLEQALRRLHVFGHYAIIPAIYMYGLIQAGEFSWNPLTVLEKVMIA